MFCASCYVQLQVSGDLQRTIRGVRFVVMRFEEYPQAVLGPRGGSWPAVNEEGRIIPEARLAAATADGTGACSRKSASEGANVAAQSTTRSWTTWQQ